MVLKYGNYCLKMMMTIMVVRKRERQWKKREKEPENVIKNILKVFNIFQKFKMPNPGLEPGSPAWKAEIIPIDQFG